MINVMKVASYIVERYEKEMHKKIDEMKLHKLLYFAQRESYVVKNEPLFPDQFQAWVYGPVMVSIREVYKLDGFLKNLQEDEEFTAYAPVFDTVFQQYAPEDSWTLSTLTHAETSWKNARKGYDTYDPCDKLMENEDIRKDAEHIKLRRFFFNELLPKLKANH